jgi:hypothetical protein
MSLTYDQLAEVLVGMAEEKSEWAGLPMPLEMHPLVLEPKFPYQFSKDEGNEPQESDNGVEINSWFNERYRCRVGIRERHGKRFAAIYPDNSVSKVFGTMFASVVWRLEAESKAISKLAELISHHKFRSYLLTGGFIETSKRSGVTYLFRRLRPTIAIRSVDDGSKCLCSLCLHPIGYYSGTWAGAMTPTDDVVAHLVLMRGDEHKFWANANQHPVHHPASGL